MSKEKFIFIFGENCISDNFFCFCLYGGCIFGELPEVFVRSEEPEKGERGAVSNPDSAFVKPAAKRCNPAPRWSFVRAACEPKWRAVFWGQADSKDLRIESKEVWEREVATRESGRPLTAPRFGCAST